MSNEFVGESFQTNIKNIWELLSDDQVFIIGIHGMGGVGKTSLVTHIKNEITRKSTFKNVFCVNVSQDFSISKLQNDIAVRIGVKLDEYDEKIRAADLSMALETKEKSVLILDDVWKYIDLQKVGIPLRVNGIKLILTTRLEHVCYQMDCAPNNIIRLEPLSYEDAWELFLLNLGYVGTPATLPPQVLRIVRSVVLECNGLALGISVMARIMKGVKDIHRWEHALNQLRNSAIGEIKEEVTKVLKFSYDNLVYKNMQNCFLYCALYHGIEIKRLTMQLVDEGLINGKMTVEEIFDEGHTMLNKLKAHCLILGDNNYLSMHGLVRDMACHILKVSHRRCMVKCNEGLTKIPEMREWTDDLEKVSLMHNEIQAIPAGSSPWCPQLSTLVLAANPISQIPDCFFHHMNALAVLDLSCNPYLTRLPNSLPNLRSLVSLQLRGCKSLKYVPPLGQLKLLSRLDISGTSIHKVPQGLEKLINLKWLDLSRNHNLMLIPGSVLPSLTNMQYLDVRYNYSLAKVNAEDVQGMSKLEHFAGSFDKCENFNDYVRITLERGCGPKTYYLHLGIGPGYSMDYLYDFNFLGDDGCQIVSIGDCKEVGHLLPRDLAKLCISDNKQWRCLCDALSFIGPSGLKHNDIRFCPKLESLFCLSGSCFLCTNLQNLESLILDHLESLSFIWKENIAQFLPPGRLFSDLKHLEISKCHQLEKLLTPGSLPQLQSLVTIKVNCCNSMMEIFAVRSTEDDDDDNSIIKLPKLKRLELRNLPQLRTVCRVIMVRGSSLQLKIDDCPKLEREPIIQVF